MSPNFIMNIVIRRFFERVWFSLAGIILLFTFLQAFLNEKLRLKNESFSQLVNYFSQNGLVSLLNSPLFWNSTIGSCIKMMLGILITAFILFITDRLLKQNYKWKATVNSVIYAQLVFLIEFIIEFFYIKTHPSILVGNYQQMFNLFSINHLLSCFQIQLPFYFEYATQVIGVFEVSYWVALSWLLSKFNDRSFRSCAVVVLSGYVTVLLLWLLFVSFLLFLKS
jgi:hypothetical protein